MEVVNTDCWPLQNGFRAACGPRVFVIGADNHCCRRSSWCPLLAVVGAALLGVAAIKLIELFGGAFDISFLRDVGNNAGPGAAASEAV